MSEEPVAPARRLNLLLDEAGLPILSPVETSRMDTFLSLLLRWNARINLTAIRDVEGILARHFLESIFCARWLPNGISTLLDFGSGAGFPGVPIAICHAEIAVTLAESQGKKAAFLRDVTRELAIPMTVWGQRAELLPSRFDCVTLRAVDRMQTAVASAAKLVVPRGWLAVMTTGADLEAIQAAAGDGFRWQPPSSLPGSVDRLLSLGQRV